MTPLPRIKPAVSHIGRPSVLPRRSRAQLVMDLYFAAAIAVVAWWVWEACR
jgi:hypothetical protein